MKTQKGKWQSGVSCGWLGLDTKGIMPKQSFKCHGPLPVGESETRFTKKTHHTPIYTPNARIPHHCNLSFALNGL